MARDYDVEKTQGTQPVDEYTLKQRREMDWAASQDPREANPARYNEVPGPNTDSVILNELFSYHPPTVESLPRFSAINQAAKNFAEVVLSNCPPCADRSDAIRKIREARMTANAAVALNGLTL